SDPSLSLRSCNTLKSNLPGPRERSPKGVFMNYSVSLNQWLERHLKMQLEIAELRSLFAILQREVDRVRAKVASYSAKPCPTCGPTPADGMVGLPDLERGDRREHGESPEHLEQLRDSPWAVEPSRVHGADYFPSGGA